MATLKDVFAEIEKDGRVCPQPMKWSELWNMLPNKRRRGNGWEPSLPLILAAWYDTPVLSKKRRLREHIEWAAKHQALDSVYAFLVSLRRDEWYYGD